MSAQAQLDAAYAYCRAWNAGDIDAIGSLFSDDPSFSYRLLPTTLGPEAKRTHSKPEILAIFKGTLATVVESLNIHLPPIDVVQGNDKVVLLLEDTGTKKDGSTYRLEYVFFVTFVPGTDKILSVTEFQDTVSIAKEFANWYEKSAGVV